MLNSRKIERQYGIKRIKYYGLISYLEENGVLAEHVENSGHKKDTYNNSTIIVKIEPEKLRLNITSGTEAMASTVLGELEKIMLRKK